MKELQAMNCNALLRKFARLGALVTLPGALTGCMQHAPAAPADLLTPSIMSAAPPKQNRLTMTSATFTVYHSEIQPVSAPSPVPPAPGRLIQF